MRRYVALLRGINVGGKNLIRMTELKDCFERQGFHDVVTYIQSGNVIFTAPAAGHAGLTRTIETMLGRAFDYQANLVLRSREEMEKIVVRAPDGFGALPTRYRYDVLFLKRPLTAAIALKQVPVKEGVDRAHAGTGVLYFSRLIRQASQSRLSRVVSLPIYQSMTIRNWSTTTKLAQLLSGGADSPTR
jgi:uncharacterized protein (DUF1697 family)